LGRSLQKQFWKKVIALQQRPEITDFARVRPTVVTGIAHFRKTDALVNNASTWLYLYLEAGLSLYLKKN